MIYFYSALYSLSLLGFLDALYLLTRYTDQSICLGSGCGAVLSSSFSTIFYLPLSLLGVIYFFSLIILIYDFQKSSSKASFLLTVWSSLGLLVSLYLTYLQWAVIESWCTYCLFSLIVNVFVFFLLIYFKVFTCVFSWQVLRSPFIKLVQSSLFILFIYFSVYFYQNQSGAKGSQTIAATINGQSFYLSDIDQQLDSQFAQKKVEIYNQRLAVLEKFLLEEEAMKQSLTVQQLSKQLIEQNPATITDGDIMAFYEKHKHRFNDAPLESLRTDIHYALSYKHTQHVIKSYISDLKNKYQFLNYLPRDFKVQVNENSIDSIYLGEKDARLTIDFFYDYECFHCKTMYSRLLSFQSEFPKDVSVSFRQYPLKTHPGAYRKSLAAICAAKQDQFFSYSNALFQSLDPLSEVQLVELANNLSLNQDQFSKCLKSKRVEQQVDFDLKEVNRLNLSGTPTLFLNQSYFSGVLSRDQLIFYFNH